MRMGRTVLIDPSIGPATLLSWIAEATTVNSRRWPPGWAQPSTVCRA